MYDVAVSVRACLRADTRVDVAWAVETRGFGSVDGNEALAVTPGGGRVGSVLSGSLDQQLVDQVAAGVTRRIVDLEVGDVDALVAGLPGGGEARCLVVPATDLPEILWDRLVEREPVCLVTRLDGDAVTGTELYDADTVADAGEHADRLFRTRASTNQVEADRVVTVLWPVPKLVIVGDGPLAAALEAASSLLGWRVQTFTDSGEATAHIHGLSALDSVVVLGHDDELTGSALRAALSGAVGYIGGVGPRRVQESRADWLAGRGVDDLSRIHGPAGLDIGAGSPAEIAVSVLAEALAVRAGRA